MHKISLDSPLALVAPVLLIWCLVLLVIAQGGWRQIAARYPAMAAPRGRRVRAVLGRIQPFGVFYGYCLDVTLAPTGLYVAIQFPFRVGHRPMLVPWSCVSSIREHIGWFGVRSLDVALTAGRFVFTLRFPSREASSLQDFAPDHFPAFQPGP